MGIYPRRAGIVAGQLFQSVVNLQLGHKAQAPHIDADQRDLTGRADPHRPQHRPIAAGGYHQIRRRHLFPQAFRILRRRNPTALLQRQIVDDGRAQIQSLGNAGIIDNAHGFNRSGQVSDLAGQSSEIPRSREKQSSIIGRALSIIY